MNFPPEHELHIRRFSRNLGVGLTLVAFIALVFALTVVKVMTLPHANSATNQTAGTNP